MRRSPKKHVRIAPFWGSMRNFKLSRENTVYQRVYEVLTGKDQNPKFAHLSKTDRQAILEILTDTKADLPDYWSGTTLVGANRN
ncbi:MAG TPA: hypothetical protein VGK48_10275 [Terriglobia bacterium]